MLNNIIFKCISDASSLSSYSIDFHVNKAYRCCFIGAYLFHWECIGEFILHLTVIELGRVRCEETNRVFCMTAKLSILS